MKNLLIKLAYKVLSYYGVETLPVLYFNGTRYYVRSYDFHNVPNEKENNTLTILAEDNKNGSLL